MLTIESYFDRLAPDDIRIKGSRIGIETVLYEYIHRGQSPEAIVSRFPSITLEQVYATILWYLHDRATLTAYLTDWLTATHEARAAQERTPPPIVLKLRQRKAAQQPGG